MRRSCVIGILLPLAMLAGVAAVTGAPSVSSSISPTLLLLPFDNSSKGKGLDWIGESFPEIMGERLKLVGPATAANVAAGLYVVPRSDRNRAFEHAGIPPNSHPSHATLFHVGQELDVDYVVWGSYNVEGNNLTAQAQLLDMKRLHLSAPIRKTGALTSIMEVQNALTADLARSISPGFQISPAEAAPALRLDAFENYIRALTAPDNNERIRRLHEALKIAPEYAPAMLELGHAYLLLRDYESAADWFARVPRNDPQAREASFFAGIAWYHLGEFDKARSAFSYVASVFPLTEVYNNLGAVELARGNSRAAAGYFQKAVQDDDQDADYRYNLGLALYRQGDIAGASQQWREAARLRPADHEVKTLLAAMDVASSGGARTAAPPRLPAERLKRSYNENSFHQLALDMRNSVEVRLATADPHTHAFYHVQQGQKLLQQKFAGEAVREFREAVTLDSDNAAAHAGLAEALMDSQTTPDSPDEDREAEAARREALAALKLHPSAQAYLVLARLDLRAHHSEAAAVNLDRALVLEPSNAAALTLKHSLESK